MWRSNLAEEIHTRLIGTDIGDGPQRLQRFQIADNDMTFHHSLCACCHCDGEDNNQRCRNHTETSSNSVNDNFLPARE